MDNHDITQRVACYIRVSSQEQKLRGLSPDAQREALSRYCESHNLKIVEWYEDLGISGRKLIKKRPALQRMIQDAEIGCFDRIIFIKLDRYFRSVAEYYECQKRLDAKNVKWTATEEKYDLTTASGRFWVTQKLAMAEYEADQAGERVDLINEYKIKTGQPITGNQNLGIAFTVEKNEEGTKKVVQDPATKELVTEYINHFLKYNNKRQAFIYVNNKYGTNYSYSSLSKLLTDTKIYGHYRGNDNYCKGYVDKETFEHIQELIDNNIKVPKSRKIYLFTGLIRCPQCKRKMTARYSSCQKTVRPSGKVYHYDRLYLQYRCNNAQANKLNCTHRKIVNEYLIEESLLTNLNQYISSYIHSVSVEDNRAKNDTHIKESIKQVKSEMTRLNNLYLKNRITEPEYDKQYEELEERLQELESQLEPFTERDLTLYEELLKSDWRALYNALTRENKRAFWRKYIKEIIVDKDSQLVDVIFYNSFGTK